MLEYVKRINAWLRSESSENHQKIYQFLFFVKTEYIDNVFDFTLVACSIGLCILHHELLWENKRWCVGGCDSMATFNIGRDWGNRAERWGLRRICPEGANGAAEYSAEQIDDVSSAGVATVSVGASTGHRGTHWVVDTDLCTPCVFNVPKLAAMRSFMINNYF